MSLRNGISGWIWFCTDLNGWMTYNCIALYLAWIIGLTWFLWSNIIASLAKASVIRPREMHAIKVQQWMVKYFTDFKRNDENESVQTSNKNLYKKSSNTTRPANKCESTFQIQSQILLFMAEQKTSLKELETKLRHCLWKLRNSSIMKLRQSYLASET